MVPHRPCSESMDRLSVFCQMIPHHHVRAAVRPRFSSSAKPRVFLARFTQLRDHRGCHCRRGICSVYLTPAPWFPTATLLLGLVITHWTVLAYSSGISRESRAASVADRPDGPQPPRFTPAAPHPERLEPARALAMRHALDPDELSHRRVVRSSTTFAAVWTTRWRSGDRCRRHGGRRNRPGISGSSVAVLGRVIAHRLICWRHRGGPREAPAAGPPVAASRGADGTQHDAVAAQFLVQNNESEAGDCCARPERIYAITMPAPGALVPLSTPACGHHADRPSFCSIRYDAHGQLAATAACR